jgi:hypothetical protein
MQLGMLGLAMRRQFGGHAEAPAEQEGSTR